MGKEIAYLIVALVAMAGAAFAYIVMPTFSMLGLFAATVILFMAMMARSCK